VPGQLLGWSGWGSITNPGADGTGVVVVLPFDVAHKFIVRRYAQKGT